MDLLTIILACAPNVQPVLIENIIAHESEGIPFAVNVNGVKVGPDQPASFDEAIKLASHYISLGYSVDMGLGQINSKNLGWLGLSVEQVFDPCNNVSATETVFLEAYDRSRMIFSGDMAVAAALSAYNTGNFHDGFRNGYVASILEKFSPHKLNAPIFVQSPAPTEFNQWGAFFSEEVKF